MAADVLLRKKAAWMWNGMEMWRLFIVRRGVMQGENE